MKFIEKKRGFRLPSGLGQGKLVAVNLFNVLKLFSLGFSETFARSQSAQFSLCLKLNEHFQGRNTPRVFLGLGRNMNPVLLLHFFSMQSPLSLAMIFRLGPDYAPVAVSSQTQLHSF